MSRRRKRKIKNKVIILFFFIIVILIGGFFMYNNSKDKNVKRDYNEDNNKKEEKVTKELEASPRNHKDFLNFKDGEYLTDKGYTLIIKNGIAYIDNMLIVNKTFSLPNSYKPINPYEAISGERCNNCIDKEVMEAFNLMKSDALSLGLSIFIASGYRSYSYQDKLYNNYVSISGKESADTYSARPGHSEHQSGLCFDLNTIDDSFANTSEGKWVNDNASNYGFVIRYPKGKESITGYQYESWHLRYVGSELAKKLYNNGDWLTLEEYYGISSSYE